MHLQQPHARVNPWIYTAGLLTPVQPPYGVPGEALPRATAVHEQHVQQIDLQAGWLLQVGTGCRASVLLYRPALQKRRPWRWRCRRALWGMAKLALWLSGQQYMPGPPGSKLFSWA